MAADEFGGGMDDYVKAMFQRTEEVRGGKGIVDEHRQMMGMGNVADGVKVGDIDGRVAQGFDVHSLCLFCDGCFDFFRMVRIYEFGMNAQLRKGIGEEFIGAAVEGGSGNDFIAGAGNVQDGVGHSRSAAGYCQACGASFQGCQSLFQYVLGGVCKTAVNEAGLPKGKRSSLPVRRGIRRKWSGKSEQLWLLWWDPVPVLHAAEGFQNDISCLP